MRKSIPENRTEFRGRQTSYNGDVLAVVSLDKRPGMIVPVQPKYGRGCDGSGDRICLEGKDRERCSSSRAAVTESTKLSKSPSSVLPETRSGLFRDDDLSEVPELLFKDNESGDEDDRDTTRSSKPGAAANGSGSGDTKASFSFCSNSDSRKSSSSSLRRRACFLLATDKSMPSILQALSTASPTGQSRERNGKV